MVLKPRYAWVIEALLWAPLLVSLAIRRSRPLLLPTLVAIFAAASLLRAVTIVSILLNSHARHFLVAPGTFLGGPKQQRQLWATAGLSTFLSALAAFQAVVMLGWVAR